MFARRTYFFLRMARFFMDFSMAFLAFVDRRRMAMVDVCLFLLNLRASTVVVEIERLMRL